MPDKLDRITGTESLKKYFDTDYLGAYSIDDGKEPILTIEGVYQGDLTLTGGRKEHHVVLKFVERAVPGIDEVKPMILNTTNRATLKKIYGQDSADVLTGKQLQLYIDPKVRNPSDGQDGPALRIKARAPRNAGNAPQPAQPAVACADCGQTITEAGGIKADTMAAGTMKKYGRSMCLACWRKQDAVDKAKLDGGAGEAVAVEAAEPEATA